MGTSSTEITMFHMYIVPLKKLEFMYSCTVEHTVAGYEKLGQSAEFAILEMNCSLQEMLRTTICMYILRYRANVEYKLCSIN